MEKKIEHMTLSNEIKQVSWGEDIVYFSQGRKWLFTTQAI